MQFSIYKGAFGAYEPSLNNNRAAVSNNRTAIEYWLDELATKEKGTRVNYLRYFKDFLKFVNMTADEVLAQRIRDTASQDRKIQRRFESLLLKFIAYEKERGYAPLTLQTIWASVRSFFEIHYYPLMMRKKDYPKGASNGVRRATKEAILKVIESNPRNKTTLTALIMAFKDSGLRVSDMRKLKCNVILENPNADIIPITLITEKTNLKAKTFFGKEAIEALKTYIEHRKKGSRKIKPENVTNDSPLFRIWKRGNVKPMSRENMTTLIRNAFLRIGEKKVSAHSLRKKLQTDLEKGNVNPNWIDQILGHELINSRDAYSLPTDEELKEAYRNAYRFIRVSPEITTSTQAPATSTQEEYSVAEARNMEEVKQLLAKGYKYEMDFNGIKLFTKK
jgi:integrase